ncbi:transaldolase [Candidatus Methylacidithermus pantelleriae]|uniref:Glucose-6-phosphate isomerase n=1 Tax=Candidatus Methylacidithermus pantelleriae TaxID=2744239 RepID=A0A8J2FSZ0_9BACT|nr:transaldolase [Candidatus Methylacidithermus pantelleriae]CAF0699268.1 Glucose-6-phosphate isomerase [Candidatus Methylacidithermus pantelleriae]
MSETLAEASFSLPEWTQRPLERLIDQWQQSDGTARFWACDSTLWTGRDEGAWMGWLDLPDTEWANLPRYRALSRELREERVKRIVLLGMGGSSLGAEVLAKVLGQEAQFARFEVLDSTHPEVIRRVADSRGLKTLYIVSSKSGTTLEPNLLFSYFFEKVSQEESEPPGRSFVAITDPGSPLEVLAAQKGFRAVFYGVPSVGGRYSVLSAYGLGATALAGIEPEPVLEKARQMRDLCRNTQSVENNPGIYLGIVLGFLATQGKDKVTILTSPSLASFGGWLEQLLAESTGKDGKVILPLTGEELGEPDSYGKDRVFVSITLPFETSTELEARLQALAQAGHPTIRFRCKEKKDLGGEFFRWEVATAVAASFLKIHPFDQPDVEASKAATRRFAEAYAQTGRLPESSPLCRQDGIELFLPQRDQPVDTGLLSHPKPVSRTLQTYWERIRPGDYVGLLAFVDPRDRVMECLGKIREKIRRTKRVATCLGIGPRYLHSTGQAFKGGPNTGVFLLVTTGNEGSELAIPGQPFGFGTIHRAQALGDFEVLAERARRVVRLHLVDSRPERWDQLWRTVDESFSLA